MNGCIITKFGLACPKSGILPTISLNSYPEILPLPVPLPFPCRTLASQKEQPNVHPVKLSVILEMPRSSPMKLSGAVERLLHSLAILQNTSRAVKLQSEIVTRMYMRGELDTTGFDVRAESDGSGRISLVVNGNHLLPILAPAGRPKKAG